MLYGPSPTKSRPEAACMDNFKNGRYVGPDPAEYDATAGDMKYSLALIGGVAAVIVAVVVLLWSVLR